MTERILEGTFEEAGHGERYYPTMEEALEFAAWINPVALTINLVNTEVGMLYQMIYHRRNEIETN